MKTGNWKKRFRCIYLNVHAGTHMPHCPQTVDIGYVKEVGWGGVIRGCFYFFLYEVTFGLVFKGLYEPDLLP